MHRNKKITILACYETSCGGETIAMDSISRELQKNKNFILKTFLHSNLQKTNFIAYFSWIFSSCIFFYRKFKNETGEVIYTSTFTAAISAIPYVKAKKFRMFFHYHGNRVPEFPRSMQLHFITQWLKYQITLFLQKKAFDYSTTVIVPTKKSKLELLQKFSFTDPNRIIVIANGYDQNKFYPITKSEKIRVRKKHGFSEEDLIVALIGRLEPKKNILCAITYLEKIPAVKLLIIYPRPTTQTEKNYKRNVEQKINLSTFSKNIFTIEDGFIKFEPAKLLGINDAVVSFSSEENLPLSQIEATACGIPYFSLNKNFIPLSKQKTLTWKKVTDFIAKEFIQLQ